MSEASLILCEKSSRWAAAFRRELRKGRSQPGLRITQTRSLPQCQRELEAAPYSIAALEATPQNLVAVAKSLASWRELFPHARFIALAQRGLEPHELLLREMGATHVTCSPRSPAPLLRVIRRHLARAPPQQLTLDEAIWNRLPWGATKRA